jgi:amino acid adenylation domain-containing protein
MDVNQSLLKKDEHDKNFKIPSPVWSCFPKDKCLHQLFEKQVQKSPNAPALKLHQQTLTYEKLNQKANAIAQHLISKSIGHGKIVGIALEPSFEMIISILGVLKSGAAYVPLDPSYPEERLSFILEDTGAKAIITENVFKEQFQGEVIDIKRTFPILSNVITVPVKPNDLAYIIYTSGSTGKPKGVMIEHTSVICLMQSLQDRYPLQLGETILLQSPFIFDASIEEIFWPLLFGGTIVIAPKELHKDIEQLANYIIDNQVQNLQLVPSLLQAFIETKNIESVSCLKRIFSGGEALSHQLRDLVLKKLPDTKLYNDYGPTEVTVSSIISECSLKDKDIVPIGVPIPNTSTYIIDKQGNLVTSPGKKGELFIGGLRLARGYINQQELTQEVFIKNPFADKEDKTQGRNLRLYKTGDIVEYTLKGELNFLGRIDEQIKLNGYRIELDEIKNAILSSGLVQSACVKLIEEDTKYISAYVVNSNQEVHSHIVEKVRNYLENVLPEYMHPKAIVRLDALPLNHVGKVDKSQLPLPKREDFTKEAKILPQTNTEVLLADVWKSVLGIAEVSLSDNFFQIGGHSLLTIKLNRAIKDKFGFEFDLGTIFEKPTLQELANEIEQRQLVKSNNQSIAAHNLIVDKNNRYEEFPLTSIQQAYWIGRQNIFDLGEVSSHGYSEYDCLELDVERLQESWNKVVQHFDALKTVFTSNGTQKILKEVPEYKFIFRDLSSLTLEKEKEALLQIRKELSHHVFDSTCWPIFKIQITKLNQGFRIHLNFDSLITDAWSDALIFKEWAKIYSNPSYLPLPLEISFRDYVIHLEEEKKTEKYQKARQYWLERVNQFPSAPKLPLAHSKLSTKQRFKRVSTQIPRSTWEKFKTSFSETSLSPSMMLCGLFAEVLGHWSNSFHFAINLTRFERRNIHPDVERLAGDFTSLNILEVNLDYKKNIQDRFLSIQNRFKDDIKHSLFNGVDFLREYAKIKGEFTSTLMPVVYTSVLGLDITPSDGDTLDHLLKAKEVFTITQTPQVWLDFKSLEFDKHLSIEWDYVEELFHPGFVEEMHKTFCELILNIASRPEILRNSSLFKPNSHSVLPYKPFPILTLDQLADNSAKSFPSSTALIYKDKTLSYKELLSKVKSLAKILKESSIQTGSIVASIFEKGFDSTIASLAIMRAGLVYLPLDPSWPKKRIQFILEDASVEAVITCKALKSLVNNHKKVFLLEKNEKLEFDSQHAISFSKLKSLAYVIYTSGSTGHPKGVIIRHESASNTIFDINQRYKVTKSDTIFAFSNLTFDLSIYDFFGALAAGAKVFIPDTVLSKEPRYWKECLLKYDITIWNSVPQIMQTLVDSISQEEAKQLKNKLRLVLLSGDWIPTSLPDKIKNVFGKSCQIVSLGGATEGSIWSIAYNIEKVNKQWDSIPYGKPLKNQSFYVLNDCLEQNPCWVPGELYIGGLGVASGYLNRPELTKERFIPNPFDSEDPFPLYKTGDLGRLLPDGNIEFLGRLDHQVKVRGHRVELGEIESVLLKQDSVKSAAVLLIKGEEAGQHSLFAYVVPKGPCEEKNLIPQLRGVLESTLPAYMIPQAFVILDELPLSANGKIDRKALPKIKREHLTQGTFVPPETDVEKKVAQLWQELLSLKKIGKYDNFFQIGGHSLLAVQMINRLQKDLNCSLSLKDFFQNPILSQVSHYVEQNTQKSLSLIPIQDSSQLIPLSFTQQRVWFLQHLFNQKSLYHIPFSVQLSGELELKALEKALCCVANRHNILRTNFVATKKDPVQKVAPPFKKIAIQVEDLSEMTNQQDQKEQVQQILLNHSQLAFDLEKDRLFRVLVLKLSPQEFILSCTFHHLIIDGWSLSLFCEELTAFYNHEVAGNSLRLKELPLQFSDFSFWQKDYDSTSLHYWVKRLDGSPTLSTFPTEKSRPEELSYQGETLSFEISEPLLKKLRNLSDQNQVTLFSTMLATFLLLLYRYTQQDDLVIGLPVANRTHPDLEPLIGFFTNTLAFRLQGVDGATPFKAFLQSLHEQVSEDLDHQETPFEKIVDELDLPRLMNANPLFQVMFSYQAKSEGEIHLSNLKSRPYLTPHKTSKFDTNFFVQDHGSHMSVLIEYATDLYDQKAIKRLGLHYQHLLTQVTEHPSEKIGALEVVTPAERHQILYDWNNKWMEFPKEKTLHQLFEEQVEKTLQAEALCFEDTSLTYEELNQKANQLAHVLLDKGVRAETPVAIALERSFEMVISVLAILKAGGCYVPLDSSMPQERMLFVLEDTKAPFLLAEETNVLEAQYTGEVIVPHEVLHQTNIPQTNPQVQMSSTQLAYIIYTSGSTGKPKGVMIQHLNVVNLLHILLKDAPLDSFSTVASITNLTFDIAGFEILWPLCFGKTLHLFPKIDQLVEDRYVQKLTQDIVQATPSVFATLQEAGWLPSKNTLVISGGETLSSKISQYLLSTAREVRNVYGPTETTIWATSTKIKEEDRITIGKPLPNYTTLILNESLSLQPIGSSGEIYIGGFGVGKGYLNNSALTSKHFIPNPYRTKEDLRLNRNSLLYKTGDKGSYTYNGYLKFSGRFDRQVKIQGNRVELGEIEEVINSYLPNQTQSCIVLYDKSNFPKANLCAFVFLKAKEPEIKELQSNLKKHLRNTLPAYMIPSNFVFSQEVPLLSSGKIDIKSLTKLIKKLDHDEVLPPTNPIEYQLLNLWQHHLQKPDISIEDNFFEIGGSSLTAITLLKNITERFKTNIPFAQFYKNPRIKSLAEVLTQKKNDDSCSISIASGQKGTLFLIHPASGLCTDYLSLGEPLKGYRVIGLNNPYFGNLEKEFNSIEQMAECYVNAIKCLQPRGPYCLGGWSFGGNVAFEVAQQLTQEGKEVKNLLLFDSINLAKQNFEIKENDVYIDPKIQGNISTTNKIFEQEVIKNMSLLKHYQPKLYRGNTVLFKGSLDDIASHYPNITEDNDWSHVTKLSVHIEKLPLRHAQFFDKKSVKILAPLIKQYI